MICLTIIVPFYNVDKYIEQCVRSLYDQDIPQDEYEVICVDDCSPDGSRVIVERLQKEYPNLQLLIHERNKKLGGARNTGLKAARGKYVMFVDSDDYLLPNTVKTLVAESEADNLDFLHFDDVLFEYGTMRREYKEIPSTEVMTGTDWFFYPGTYWITHHVTAWHKIYRRSFLIENDLFFIEDTMYEDNDYAFRVHAAAKRVAHLNKSIYVYRLNEQSVTHKKYDFLHALYFSKILPVMLNLRTTFMKSGETRRYITTIDSFIRWIIDVLVRIVPSFDTNQSMTIRKNLKGISLYRSFQVCSYSAFIRLLRMVYGL